MITRDPLFKGLTRKAMLFGVPMFPLFFAFAALVMSAAIGAVITKNGTPWIVMIIFAFPVIGIMRLLVKHDDEKFKLIWLWFLSRVREKNMPFWKALSYGPVSYKKRKW
jgi:type IV secretion system protein VirB3